MVLETKIKRTDLLDLEFIKEGDIIDIEDEDRELITLIYRNGLCTTKELYGNIYEIGYKTENEIVYINEPQKLKISENDKSSYLFYYCKLINEGLIA